MITDEDLADFAVGATLDRYQQIADQTAIYPGKHSLIGLAYVTLKLNGEAGEVAEKVGKAMRDDAGVITLERREALVAEAGDVLWYVSALCKELDIPLSTVAFRNLQKLKSRAERGKLQGDGDER